MQLEGASDSHYLFELTSHWQYNRLEARALFASFTWMPGKIHKKGDTYAIL